MAEEPSYPLAAQIPLQTFSLPLFPEQVSRLRSLTLTADIKLDEYQNLVQGPPSPDETFNIPTNLPQSLTHLTFELFSLGFPAGYLTSIASSLPNLKSLTLFSCLIDGITEGSREDAEVFFKKTPLLAELHVLDTFARVGFWQKAARVFVQRAKESTDSAEGGLKVLEVSYTYRGFEDDDFLARVGGEEWADWALGGAVGLAFALVPEAASDIENGDGDESEREKKIEGVLPFAVDSRASETLRKKLSASAAGSLRELRMLDLSLWTLRSSEVGTILNSNADQEGRGTIVDLTASILMEDGWWPKLVEVITTAGKSLDGLEVVGVPSDTQEMRAAVHNGKSEGGSEVALLDKNDLEALAAVCPSLLRLTMTILRARSFGRISWTKTEKGLWEENRA